MEHEEISAEEFRLQLAIAEVRDSGKRVRRSIVICAAR